MKACLLSLALCCVLAPTGQAVQFVFTGSDIYTTLPVAGGSASYLGPGGSNSFVFSTGWTFTDGRGVVGDGGNDAFDYFGWWSNLGSLSLTRRTEALTGQNIYRWFDTIINSTGAPVSLTVNFVGDLGSDGSTVLRNSGTSYTVTAENAGTPTNDPVVAFVYGNNAWAGSNITRAFGQGGNGGTAERISLSIALNLAPGEQVSFLFFTFLARDETDRTGDVLLATTRAGELVANPILAGLSAQEVARIINFNEGAPSSGVPEPGAMLLLGAGLTAVALLRRRG